jgi:hypothetical protein
VPPTGAASSNFEAASKLNCTIDPAEVNQKAAGATSFAAISTLVACRYLNRTFGLTGEEVRKAVGERLQILADTSKTFDPENRLLNSYFHEFFGA